MFIRCLELVNVEMYRDWSSRHMGPNASKVQEKSHGLFTLRAVFFYPLPKTLLTGCGLLTTRNENIFAHAGFFGPASRQHCHFVSFLNKINSSVLLNPHRSCCLYDRILNLAAKKVFSDGIQVFITQWCRIKASYIGSRVHSYGKIFLIRLHTTCNRVRSLSGSFCGLVPLHARCFNLNRIVVSPYSHLPPTLIPTRVRALDKNIEPGRSLEKNFCLYFIINLF